MVPMAHHIWRSRYPSRRPDRPLSLSKKMCSRGRQSHVLRRFEYLAICKFLLLRFLFFFLKEQK